MLLWEKNPKFFWPKPLGGVGEVGGKGVDSIFKKSKKKKSGRSRDVVMGEKLKKSC